MSASFKVGDDTPKREEMEKKRKQEHEIVAWNEAKRF